ncbi:TIGR00730 family Rossman fold protein [Streptomyces griseoluteus]|uniref:LOG family protein n=1 Tax=Streptomyces griseoluteus TaxID=29306 RepID=UPI0033D554CC
MSASLSVCVFCGFSPGVGPRYLEAAGQLGARLGRRGHRLIYGAGTGGLMGAVAAGAAAEGGSIVGLIPDFLRVREQADELPGQRLILTGDLLERKRRMIEEADGFIALPGGYGTLDEVLEVISMKALGILSAPLVLLNVDDAWTPLVALIESLHVRGFLHDLNVYTVVDGPVQALDHIERLAAGDRPEHRPAILQR